MFYCESCRKEHGWPMGITTSYGACEMCHETATCHDVPSSALPPSKKEKKAMSKKAKKGDAKALTPADEAQCQCERPNGASFLTFGMAPGTVRCKNRPIVIATEAKATHEDGERGSMSLCAHCMNKLLDLKGLDFATFRAIEHEGEDKGV